MDEKYLAEANDAYPRNMEISVRKENKTVFE